MDEETKELEDSNMHLVGDDAVLPVVDDGSDADTDETGEEKEEDDEEEEEEDDESEVE